MYPPEVGYLGSHGLWYPVESSTELLACATWRPVLLVLLQVLQSSMSSRVQDLPYPDILWHLHKQVPRGLEVCQDLRDQVQSYSPALRGTLRYAAYCSVLQAAGEEAKRYPANPGILWTLLK